MGGSPVADAGESGASWAAEFLNGGGALGDAIDEAKAAADVYVRATRRKRVWGLLSPPSSVRRNDPVHLREDFLHAAYGVFDRAKGEANHASERRHESGKPDKASAGIRAAIEKSRQRRHTADTRPNLHDTTLTPAPQEFGVSHEGAERLVTRWLRSLGIEDANFTRFKKDGGVDVESRDFVVQVKHQQGNVTSKDVQAIAGIAAASSRRALFFTSSSYTRDAAAFADQARVGLFRFDAERGTLTAFNDYARRTVGGSPRR